MYLQDQGYREGLTISGARKGLWPEILAIRSRAYRPLPGNSPANPGHSLPANPGHNPAGNIPPGQAA